MRRWGLTVVIVLMMAAAGACGKSGGDAGRAGDVTGAIVQPDIAPSSAAADARGEEAPERGGPADADTEEKKTVYPLTVQDAGGQTLTFDQAPERIVSISPAETEILFALGLGDRIVGVSDFADYPEEAKSKPKMGGIVQPNAEVIIGAAPDLVIGGISMEEQAAARLRDFGLKVYRTDPKSLDDVIGNILQMGVITDTQERAEELAARMRADVRAVTETVAAVKEDERKRVYAEFAPGWTVGSGEYLDELIRIAGGINIAGDMAGWNRIDEEKIIRDDPEVILYAEGLTDYESGRTLEDIITSRSGWSGITAIREGRLIPVDSNSMVRPGPRLTQALLEIARGLHPELFEP